MRIVVLSTFDVWPPRDGGQTRYVNLWTRFSRDHEIKILVYDFRHTGPEHRYKLSDNVEVIVSTALPEDAGRFHEASGVTSLWLHDVLCLCEYRFSDAFLRALHCEIRDCDVLVASHPYLAPVAFPLAPSSVLKIYESYNIELDIKRRYFETGSNKQLLRDFLNVVQRGEAIAARQADHVTVVSDNDKIRMSELYGISIDKITVVPNGASISHLAPASKEERAEMRHILGIADGMVGIFLGSAFAANVNSYLCARSQLQASGFRGTMLLLGSIEEIDRSSWSGVNFKERWLGFVPEEVKSALLMTADFALHLMFDGAGTNLKLFEYMGAGLPILANDFGARGVAQLGWFWRVETPGSIKDALTQIAAGEAEVTRRAGDARRIALSHFDWKQIAAGFEEGMVKGFGR
jgi:glycosyltransferase involved in cell wall biosynthesis